MKRRDFLSRTALGLGTAVLGSRAVSCGSPSVAPTPSPPATVFKASDLVSLGSTGIQASRLACGTGTAGSNHQSDQSALGQGLVDLLVHGYNQGLTFWDSADAYGTHPYIAEALKTVPRDKVVIETKSDSRTHDDMKADVDRFLTELNTSYIDIVLMHAIGLNAPEADWPVQLQGAMDALSEARQEGKVRAVGCSVHSIEALQAASTSPWVQVQVVRLNCAGTNMDADNATVVPILSAMRTAGKAIVGIKILSEGELRTRVDEALKYALTVGVLDAFIIGAESQAEQDDLVSRIAAVTV
jgi:aryl-alcohol dehydrogenase-like predicted oxidoreductase